MLSSAHVERDLKLNHVQQRLEGFASSIYLGLIQSQTTTRYILLRSKSDSTLAIILHQARFLGQIMVH